MTEHATPQQHDSDDRLQLLIEITRDLDMDLDKLLSQILNRLKTVIPGADIGVVYFYDNLQEALIPRSCLGYDQQAMRYLKLFAGESISGRVFQQGIALITQSREDVEQSGGSLNAENDRHYRKAIGDRTITSNICAPLTIGEQTTIGTITLSSTHSPLVPKDLDLLTAIAGRISQTIYQSKISRRITPKRSTLSHFSRRFTRRHIGNFPHSTATLFQPASARYQRIFTGLNKPDQRPGSLCASTRPGTPSQESEREGTLFV